MKTDLKRLKSAIEFNADNVKNLILVGERFFNPRVIKYHNLTEKQRLALLKLLITKLKQGIDKLTPNPNDKTTNN